MCGGINFCFLGIFDMFGGVGLGSDSSGLVLLNICCLSRVASRN